MGNPLAYTLAMLGLHYRCASATSLCFCSRASAGHEQYALEEHKAQHSIPLVVIVKEIPTHPNFHNSFINLI